MTKKKSANKFPLLILLSTLFIILIFFFLNESLFQFKIKGNVIPKPYNPYPYKIPQIENKRSYLIYVVGDSMVEALGKNADDLREDLIGYYPKHEFVNYNYGFGATNILSLPARLYEKTSYHGEEFPAIINQGYDLIIIESFAYNPLSDMKLADGLRKQSEILDTTFKELIKTHPNSVISVMATIAPNKKYFGKGMLDLSATERDKWASERIAYLENAIKFAQERNIPLINVYERSLNEKGEGDLRYINPTDYVHPSTDGVQLICKTIADFIYENKIFPE